MKFYKIIKMGLKLRLLNFLTVINKFIESFVAQFLYEVVILKNWIGVICGQSCI
jgi:hypothetical protein